MMVCQRSTAAGYVLTRLKLEQSLGNVIASAGVTTADPAGTGMETKNDQSPRRCQWCSEAAAETDTHCRACGANLAQREQIGEVVIPGVTHVDPGLKSYAAQPLRIPGASPSQYVAGPAMGAAVMVGGPAGLVALAGLGAVAATEYAGAGRGPMTQADLDKLGQPSEAALQMLKKLDEEKTATTEPADSDAAADSGAGSGQGGAPANPPAGRPTIL